MSDADVDLDCTTCGEAISLPQKNWLPCAECDRSYHLYCLNPPLSEKPRGRWSCPAHGKDNTIQIEIDKESDRYLQLHLFPYQTVTKKPCSKRRCRRPPMRAIEPPQIDRMHNEIALGRMLKEKKETPILQSLMRKNKTKLLGEYFDELKHSQAQLVAQALDMQTAAGIDLDTSNATATLQQLSAMSPLFVQFLAWQRLMQLPDEVGLLDRGDACQALEGTALKKRKRLPSEDEPADEPPVEVVPKKQQKTSRVSSVTERKEKEHLPSEDPVPEPPANPEPASQPAEPAAPEKVTSPSKPTRRNQRKTVAASRKAAEQRKKEQEEIHAAIEAEEALESPASKANSPPSPADAEPTPMEVEPSESQEMPPPAKAVPKTAPRKSSLGMDDETESITESASVISARPSRQSLSDASSMDATPPRAKAPSSSATTAPEEESPLPLVPASSDPPTRIDLIVTAEILTEPKVFSIPLTDLPVRVGRNDPRGGAPKKQSLAVNLQEISNHPAVKRVSHFHLEILDRTGKYILLCLGRNGMMVDDTLISKNECITLSSGRVVGIGPFHVRFEFV